MNQNTTLATGEGSLLGRLPAPGASPDSGEGAIRQTRAEPQQVACELSGDGAPDSDRLPEGSTGEAPAPALPWPGASAAASRSESGPPKGGPTTRTHTGGLATTQHGWAAPGRVGDGRTDNGRRFVVGGWPRGRASTTRRTPRRPSGAIAAETQEGVRLDTSLPAWCGSDRAGEGRPRPEDTVRSSRTKRRTKRTKPRTQ